MCSHPNLAISKVGVGSARRSEGERNRSALEDLPVREQAGPRCGEGLAAYPDSPSAGFSGRAAHVGAAFVVGVASDADGCGEGLAAYPTELIEHLIEHAEPFVELVAGDRQRGRNDDHVPVGHQVEAALHRRLGELRNRRKRLSGGIEGN